jgi:hypothetical protein
LNESIVHGKSAEADTTGKTLSIPFYMMLPSLLSLIVQCSNLLSKSVINTQFNIADLKTIFITFPFLRDKSINRIRDSGFRSIAGE